MSRAFTFIGVALIALYLFVIGTLVAGTKLDRASAIMYLSQLVVWVSLAIFWQARAAKLQRERDRA